MNPTRNLLLLTAVVLLLNSCTDEMTPPEKPNYKHPREMTWKADTLEMPDWAIQLLPMDLLVLSPTEAWLTAWIGHGQIYKYNGEDWTLVEDIGGGIDCLTGRTKDEIWAGGYIGRDINGQYAQDVYISKNENEKWVIAEIKMRGHILDMSTDPKGRIWASGYNGLVMKYENGKWLADTIEIGYAKTFSNAVYFLRCIEQYNNKQNLIGWVIDFERKKEIYYYIEGEMNNWSVVDSMVIDSPSSEIKWGNWGIYKSNDGKLYTYGLGGIWMKNNNKWERVYNLSGEMYEMRGVTKDYLLAVSAFRRLFYYDGTKWERIEDVLKVSDPYFSFDCVWTNGYEIIVAGSGMMDGVQKTVIWHGK